MGSSYQDVNIFVGTSIPLAMEGLGGRNPQGYMSWSWAEPPGRRRQL